MPKRSFRFDDGDIIRHEGRSVRVYFSQEYGSGVFSDYIPLQEKDGMHILPTAPGSASPVPASHQDAPGILGGRTEE